MKKTRGPLTRQFTAIIQRDGKWFIGFCPEVPGANGQGRTRASCLKSLSAAIKLILEIQEEELAHLCNKDAERTLLSVA